MIRSARPHDVPVILEMISALADYERAADEVRATPELLHTHLFGPDAVAHCLLVADGPDNQVVGFAVWFRTFSTWLGRPGIYLEDLFVRPEVRGGGHGRALLQALAQIAVERGYGRIEWSVLDWNEPAHGFYRTLGARPQDEWTVWRLTGDALERLGSPLG